MGRAVKPGAMPEDPARSGKTECAVIKAMRAAVLSESGDFDKLVIKDLPVPQPQPAWVRIRVKAFRVNESEVTRRKGLSSPDFTMPRVLGIECVGAVGASR